MTLWRTVRVFLSSTFRDMHGERDHLVKVVFPRLRERLLPFRIELIDVDLRWGITAEQAENEKVLSLCLEQIDECRPFFLGFLGHRYGWVPPRLPNDARAAFPWIDDHPGASVTELEMLHGALRPDVPPARALFCLRDESALASIPESERSAVFAEPSPDGVRRLVQLKQRITGSGYPVWTYPCRWDQETYDRPTRRKGRLVGLHEFGNQVENWLWDAICKEGRPDTAPPPTGLWAWLRRMARVVRSPQRPADDAGLDEEADFHERFLKSRLRSPDSRLPVYSRHDDLNDILHAYAAGGDDRPCLLTGAPGSGKSAALAHFVDTFHAAHPKDVVLPHFVGASPKTTSGHALLGRLCGELQRQLGLRTPIPDDPPGRIGAFLSLLAEAPPRRRVVVVLDALDQLDGGLGVDGLPWLPERLAPHVKLVVSCAEPPGPPPPLLRALQERVGRRLVMKPLSAEDRNHILRTVPRISAKTLDDGQVEALLSNPATANPLFLLVALEELRGFGSFELLNQMIAELPREGDTLTALFTQVFGRLEEEFPSEVVRALLSLLACARRGLSDAELRELTAGCLGAEELFAVLRQLRPYLLSRAGRWDFYHGSIRLAVEERYLKRRGDGGASPSAEERAVRQRLVDYFRPRRLEARGVEELPWQLAALRDWDRLSELLADLPFFAAAWEANEFEVRELWSRLEAESPLRMVEAYRSVVEDPSRQEAEQLWLVAELLYTTGHPKEAGLLRGHLIEHYRDVDERTYSTALGNQALILADQGDLEGAMRLYKQAEDICRRLNYPAGLGRCLGNQARILSARGDLKGAMRLLKQAEDICRRLNDPAGLSHSLNNQAGILQAQGDLAGGHAPA